MHARAIEHSICLRRELSETRYRLPISDELVVLLHRALRYIFKICQDILWRCFVLGDGHCQTADIGIIDYIIDIQSKSAVVS